MYVPPGSVAGSKVPVTVSPAKVQYPQFKGVPFNISIKFIEGSVSQKSKGVGIPTVPPASPASGPPKASLGPTGVNCI